MNANYLELCDFSHDIYRKHEDLKTMTDAELEYHFFTYGIAEGRSYGPVSSRNDFINLINTRGKMLEIGPLDRPQLDAQAPNYYSLDVFTKEQLVNNYAIDPNVIKENIVEPSYVISNNDYSVIKEKFDFIFSSHNIEHMPCLVSFLKNLSSVLADDGLCYFAIPDKRYCFDHFKNETNIYDVLQSYYEKNYRPRLMDVLKIGSLVTHNNPVDHWNGIHGEINPEPILIQQYEGLLNQYKTGLYVDAHVSFFTPESFEKIISTLNVLKIIDLKIHKIYHTLYGSVEFFVILKMEEKS
jgi:SAM-dependent methyltransferase